MLCPSLTPTDIEPTDIPNARLCLCPRTLCFLSQARAGLSSVARSEGAALQHTLDGAGDWPETGWLAHGACKCFVVLNKRRTTPFFLAVSLCAADRMPKASWIIGGSQ